MNRIHGVNETRVVLYIHFLRHGSLKKKKKKKKKKLRSTKFISNILGHDEYCIKYKDFFYRILCYEI
jgi:hypothetical protein